MNNLKSRIKETRTNLGLSQARLASVAGVSQPTVANWETGSHIPRKNALAKISEALGVEQHWLLSGDQDSGRRSTEAYLARPIRHIPIYEWKKAHQNFAAAVPRSYLPYPTEEPDAFALIDFDTPDARHRILIFDRQIGALQPTDICLWSDGEAVRLDETRRLPSGREASGRLCAEIKAFTP